VFGRSQSVKESSLRFFTIFDSKAQIYTKPLVAPNKETIVRELLNMMRDPSQANNMYLLNAEDYSLFDCGSFDSSTGLMSAGNLEHVANLHDLRALVKVDRPGPGIVAT